MCNGLIIQSYSVERGIYQRERDTQIISAILKKSHALEIGIEIEKETDRNLEQRKCHLHFGNCS